MTTFEYIKRKKDKNYKSRFVIRRNSFERRDESSSKVSSERNPSIRDPSVKELSVREVERSH